jgi:hypothetical protein
MVDVPHVEVEFFAVPDVVPETLEALTLPLPVASLP